MSKSMIAVFSLIACVVVVQSQPLSEDTLKIDQTPNVINGDESFGVDVASDGSKSQNYARVKRWCPFPITRSILGIPCPSEGNSSSITNMNLGGGTIDNRQFVDPTSQGGQKYQ